MLNNDSTASFVAILHRHDHGAGRRRLGQAAGIGEQFSVQPMQTVIAHCGGAVLQLAE